MPSYPPCTTFFIVFIRRVQLKGVSLTNNKQYNTNNKSSQQTKTKQNIITQHQENVFNSIKLTFLSLFFSTLKTYTHTDILNLSRIHTYAHTYSQGHTQARKWVQSRRRGRG